MTKILDSGLQATDFEIDGIIDSHDFCDAYIVSASVLDNGEWRDATDEELDDMNEDSCLVYSVVENHIY